MSSEAAEAEENTSTTTPAADDMDLLNIDWSQVLRHLNINNVQNEHGPGQQDPPPPPSLVSVTRVVTYAEPLQIPIDFQLQDCRLVNIDSNATSTTTENSQQHQQQSSHLFEDKKVSELLDDNYSELNNGHHDPESPYNNKITESHSTTNDNNKDAVGGLSQLPNSKRKRKRKLKILSCLVCDMKFSGLSSLNRHLEYIHPDDSDSFICDICNRDFTQSLDLDKHRKIVHREGIRTGEGEGCFECEACHAEFSRKLSLKCHLKHCLSKQDWFTKKSSAKKVKLPPLAKCPVCHKFFKDSTYCKYHMKEEHGDRKKEIHKIRVSSQIFHNDRHQPSICSDNYSSDEGITLDTKIPASTENHSGPSSSNANTSITEGEESHMELEKSLEGEAPELSDDNKSLDTKSPKIPVGVENHSGPSSSNTTTSLTEGEDSRLELEESLESLEGLAPKVHDENNPLDTKSTKIPATLEDHSESSNANTRIDKEDESHLELEKSLEGSVPKVQDENKPLDTKSTKITAVVEDHPEPSNANTSIFEEDIPSSRPELEKSLEMSIPKTLDQKKTLDTKSANILTTAENHPGPSNAKINIRKKIVPSSRMKLKKSFDVSVPKVHDEKKTLDTKSIKIPATTENHSDPLNSSASICKETIPSSHPELRKSLETAVPDEKKTPDTKSTENHSGSSNTKASIRKKIVLSSRLLLQKSLEVSDPKPADLKKTHYDESTKSLGTKCTKLPAITENHSLPASLNANTSVTKEDESRLELEKSLEASAPKLSDDNKSLGTKSTKIPPTTENRSDHLNSSTIICKETKKSVSDEKRTPDTKSTKILVSTETHSGSPKNKPSIRKKIVLSSRQLLKKSLEVSDPKPADQKKTLDDEFTKTPPAIENHLEPLSSNTSTCEKAVPSSHLELKKSLEVSAPKPPYAKKTRGTKSNKIPATTKNHSGPASLNANTNVTKEDGSRLELEKSLEGAAPKLSGDNKSLGTKSTKIHATTENHSGFSKTKESIRKKIVLSSRLLLKKSLEMSDPKPADHNKTLDVESIKIPPAAENHLEPSSANIITCEKAVHSPHLELEKSLEVSAPKLAHDKRTRGTKSTKIPATTENHSGPASVNANASVTKDDESRLEVEKSLEVSASKLPGGKKTRGTKSPKIPATIENHSEPASVNANISVTKEDESLLEVKKSFEGSAPKLAHDKRTRGTKSTKIPATTKNHSGPASVNANASVTKEDESRLEVDKSLEVSASKLPGGKKTRGTKSSKIPATIENDTGLSNANTTFTPTTVPSYLLNLEKSIEVSVLKLPLKRLFNGSHHQGVQDEDNIKPKRGRGRPKKSSTTAVSKTSNPSSLISHSIRVSITEMLFKPLLNTEMTEIGITEVSLSDDNFSQPWYLCYKCAHAFAIKSEAEFHLLNCSTQGEDKIFNSRRKDSRPPKKKKKQHTNDEVQSEPEVVLGL